MKITKIKFSCHDRTANNMSERVTLEAEIDAKDNISEAINYLRNQATAALVGREKASDFYHKYWNLERGVRSMEESYNESKKEYDKLTEFCKVQGLKSDFKEFPSHSFSVPVLPSEIVSEF
jgi:D-arabinose 1-dehydrogenase-like Zn-dependent alcohol dehydrogenase